MITSQVSVIIQKIIATKQALQYPCSDPALNTPPTVEKTLTVAWLRAQSESGEESGLKVRLSTS